MNMQAENYILEIENLKFAYPSYSKDEPPINVLDDFNLKVKRGEFVSVMGPTGAGKTTLCLALNGIVPHSSGGSFGGDIQICSMNTKETPISNLAQKIGIVFQDPETQLFCMTVEDEVAFGLENMGLPRDEMRIKIDAALTAVGLRHLTDRSPFHLSGGQKQRVAIASMLAMEPEILILDEPTSGLDPIGKKEVFQVVERLRQEKNMTIIMIEQESERVAEFSDRVIIMDQGKIVLEGEPRVVFEQVDLLREIGVSIPQVAELAYDMNHKYGGDCSFLSVDEAASHFTVDIKEHLRIARRRDYGWNRLIAGAGR
ncbi:MAG TPA: ATP-binding cassette domain-containing protein [Syntrophomonas sp.]|nr:ATP-binding cassette domain-containing protein [Syntrophomonas sp.]